TFGKFNRCNQLFELAVIGAVDHLCLTNETLSCKCCWFSFEQEPNDVELLGENKPAFSSYNSSPILNYIGYIDTTNCSDDLWCNNTNKSINEIVGRLGVGDAACEL
ncbi:MAG: hypothetical protein ACP5JY_01085, partial [Candidatus Nanoarchaeia archaeon]